MKKKTFPIHLTEEEHKKIKIKATINGETMKEFIMKAVMEAAEKE